MKKWIVPVVMLAVLLYGGIQLAFFRPDALTVRVAALAPDRALSDAAKDHPQTAADVSRRHDREPGEHSDDQAANDRRLEVAALHARRPPDVTVRGPRS